MESGHRIGRTVKAKVSKSRYYHFTLHLILQIILKINPIFVIIIEALADFLLGEGKLESFLEDYPPIDINISRARSGLNEARKHLLNSTTELGKKVHIVVMIL